MQQFDLTGRVALVTGASSGLGAEFARILAAAGARVLVGARRTERLDALVAEILAAGGEARRSAWM
jgi:NAD(P)-dependent dehydrogenase (short-subunit alcohol dehydrogenase family)